MANEYRGKVEYFTDFEAGPHRLLVAVPCLVEGLSDYVWALLDTAAEWSILPPAIARELDLDLTPDPIVPPILSRFGKLFGRWERRTVCFETDGGPLEIEATWFVSEDWPGPAVLGWRGTLELLRFAVDPKPVNWEQDWFWVGERRSS